jgi:hypothetical protein
MFAPASVKGSTSEVAGALDDGAEIDAIADKQGGRTALMVRVRQIVLFPTDYVDLQRRLIDLLVVALMTRPMPPTPFTSLAPSYTQVGFLRQQAACLAGKHKVVKKLLTAGADWRIGEKDGYTCMHGAGFQGYSFFCVSSNLLHRHHQALSHLIDLFRCHLFLSNVSSMCQFHLIYACPSRAVQGGVSSHPCRCTCSRLASRRISPDSSHVLGQQVSLSA